MRIHAMLSRLAQIKSVLRLRAFDTSTEAGRSQERYRRALLNTLGTFASKAVYLLVLVISTPMVLAYLQKERYGIWQTITSLVALWGFSDLGLSQGLVNVVADADGKRDIKTMRRAIVSATAVMICSMVVLGLVFAALYPVLPWVRILNPQSPQAIREAGPAVAVFVGYFLITVPMGLVGSAQFGLQEGLTISGWNSLTSIASLLGLLIARHYNVSLPVFMMFWSGGLIPIRLVQGIHFFGWSHPELRPSLKEFDPDMARRLLRTGLMFMIISMSVAIGCTSDRMVLTQIMGPSSVTEYSIIYTLFSVITIATAAILSPLWPAYGEACSRGDLRWIRRTLWRSSMISFLMTASTCAVLLIFGKWILHLWVHGAVNPTVMTMLPFGLFLVINGLHFPIALVLNGLTVIRFQIFCSVTAATVNLGLSILLTKRIGMPGVMWGTVFAFGFFQLLPEVWYVRRLLKRHEQIEISRGPQLPLDERLPPDQLQTMMGI